MELENSELSQTEYTGIIKEQKAEIDKLTQITGKTINPLNYNTEILKAIETIKVSDTSIYIKLNKNLILHTENSVLVSDNLNIQIAGQIHLNPVVKLFKAIQSKFKRIGRLAHDLPDLG